MDERQDAAIDAQRRRGSIARLAIAAAAFFAFLCTAIALLWLIGRVFTDRYAWSQWLWWMPTPIALAIAALGCALALRPGRIQTKRRRRIARWIIALAAIGIYFLAIEHRFIRLSSPHTPIERPSLKLVHWNASHVQQGSPAEYARKIIELDADLTILTNPGRILWEQPLHDWLGSEENRPKLAGRFAVLTRLPIQELRMLVEAEGISIVLLKIDAPPLGRTLSLFLVDLPSDPRLPRMRTARRARQLLDQALSISADPIAPDLVVGDFNIPRGSASIRALFPTMRHAFHEAGRGYGASFHRDWPLWHIDHILISDNVRVPHYELIDLDMGRHYAQVIGIAP